MPETSELIQDEIRIMRRSMLGVYADVPFPDLGTFQQRTKQSAAEILKENQALVDSLLSSLDKPTSAVAELDVPSDYFDVAKRVGLCGPQIMRARILSAFQREELAVYDNNTVHKYLNGICAKINEVIRASGKLPKGWGGQGEARWQWKVLPVEGCMHVSTVKYSGVVPVEVLRVMERAHNALDAAGFPRSEYGWSVSEVVEYPDPFLAIGFKGTENWFVLAQWDEPGFSILKG